jgi:hypothetical protein
MSRLVFLLEEYSMKVFLDGLLPRLFPELRFLCVHHEGKQDLEKSIPRKLKAWREPGVQFCVIRDQDSDECVALKERLVGLCQSAGRADTVVRIACKELEAWYFGEPDALARAFDRDKLRHLGTQQRFRDPDSIVQPSRALASLVEEFQKVSGARAMAREMTRETASRSFGHLISAVSRFAE